jgi:1,4-dihydroxy-2-naphthoate polyprenyltransferase
MTATTPITPLRAWLLACRPKTLWAGVAPVIVGTALAHHLGQVHWGIAAVCLLAAISVQIGANLANDYFDFLKGADTDARIGPVRVTQAGLIPPATVRRAFIFAFAVTVACSIVLAVRGGWGIVGLGLVCVACGYLYTGGPYPLGYHGLGDLFALIFFGPVAVVATCYLQALAVTGYVVVAGLAPGLFAVALIAVNNLRDIDSDRQAGKRTLAVLLGPRFARAEYLAVVTGAVLIPVLLYLVSRQHPWTLLTLATLALAVPAFRGVLTRRDGPALNRCLALTGQMELAFSVLYAVGLVLP